MRRVRDTVIVPLSYDFAREHAAALLGVSQGVEWDDWTSEELLTELPELCRYPCTWSVNNMETSRSARTVRVLQYSCNIDSIYDMR